MKIFVRRRHAPRLGLRERASFGTRWQSVAEFSVYLAVRMKTLQPEKKYAEKKKHEIPQKQVYRDISVYEYSGPPPPYTAVHPERRPRPQRRASAPRRSRPIKPADPESPQAHSCIRSWLELPGALEPGIQTWLRERSGVDPGTRLH